MRQSCSYSSPSHSSPQPPNSRSRASLWRKWVRGPKGTGQLVAVVPAPGECFSQHSRGRKAVAGLPRQACGAGGDLLALASGRMGCRQARLLLHTPCRSSLLPTVEIFIEPVLSQSLRTKYPYMHFFMQLSILRPYTCHSLATPKPRCVISSHLITCNSSLTQRFVMVPLKTGGILEFTKYIV